MFYKNIIYAKIRKTFFIIFYLLFFIIFILIVKNFLPSEIFALSKSGYSEKHKHEIANIVNQFYQNTDSGEYGVLFDKILLGKWSSIEKKEGREYHNFDSLMEEQEFFSKALKAFGQNGWRTRIISLDITNVEVIAEIDMEKKYPREYEIIRNIRAGRNIKDVYVAEVDGFRVERCLITEIDRKFIVLLMDDEWKMVLSGTPDYIDLFFGYHWFKNYEF